MANWNGLILTTKGIALLSKVEAGTTLEMTKIKLGDGVLPDGQNLEDLTDLVSPKQILGIASREAQKNEDGEFNGLCKISSTISNVGLTQGYYVRELGIFANDPDAGEILYAVTTDTAPDYLPAQGGATVISQEFALYVAISNMESIEVQIDPGALATMGYVKLNINGHNSSADSHAAAFVKHNAASDAHYDMTGATNTKAGKRGFVPAPPIGANNKFLKGDGTYQGVATTEQAKAGTDDIAPMTAKKVAEAIEAQGIPVGDVVYRPFLMKGYVKANGATVKRSDYPRLVKYANTYGLWTDNPTNEPWKYGKGDGSTTMVLPDYRDRVIQGGDIPVLLQAGLPNVQLYIGRVEYYTPNPPNVIMSNVENAKTFRDEDFASDSLAYVSISLQRGNAIYGNSTTVQPPAIRLIPQLKF